MKYVLFAFAALCMTCVAGDWSTWRGDSGLSGRSDTAVPDRPERLWRYLADADLTGTPVGTKNRIYAATTLGKVIALDGNGGEVWTCELGADDERISTPLAMAGEILVACSATGVVYGISIKDGSEEWIYNGGGEINGAPVVLGESAFILAKEEGIVHCINTKDGSTQWVSRAEARADGHPAVADGSVIYGNCNAMLLFLDASDGALRDVVEFGEGHEIAGAPSSAGGSVYVGTRAGSLKCVDTKTMKLRWSQDSGAIELFASPAVVKGGIVVSTDDGTLVCFLKGEKAWVYEGSRDLGPPVAAGDKVIVINDGELTVLSAKDASLLGSVKCPSSDYPPAIIDGKIVVAGDDSSIYAFGAEQ